MKKTLAFCLAALLLTGAASCKKTEPTAAPAPAAPAAPTAASDPAAAAPAEDTAAAAPAEDTAGPSDIPAPPDVAAPPADAIKTASGLAYKKLQENPSGKAPVESDIVEVNYTGWTVDGKMFDTSLSSGQPATFSLDALIAGMKEALMLGRTGEKMRVWIPESLAYQGRPGAPAGMLVFDFDILNIVTPAMPPKEIPADAVKLENGCAYKIVKTTPDAPQIKDSDFVMLEFSGWTQNDGKLFQTSKQTGEPLAAPVNTMFPGWRSILPNVHSGDVVQMWIPQALGISPDGESLAGDLIFEVSIIKHIELPAAPAELKEPPADAEKTASGLATKVLAAGTGDARPTADSFVTVQYSGWTADGSMFDSSIPRGEAASFNLNQVIPGWRETVMLMTKGEKRRAWIPEELAYKDNPYGPQGMLIFDIELIDFNTPETAAAPAPTADAAPAPAADAAPAPAADAAPAPAANAAPAPAADAAPAPAAN